MAKDDKPLSERALLAAYVASGKSIARACRDLSIPRTTGYRIAATPEFQSHVNKLRQRFIDRAFGRLSRLAVRAVDAIAGVMKTGRDEVKLAAARIALDQLMNLRDSLALAKYIAELETRLQAAQDGETRRRSIHGKKQVVGPRRVVG